VGNARKNLSLYVSLEIYTSSVLDVAIFIKKVLIILLSTYKLDFKVKMHNEISKKENIFGFFGYDICKIKALTPHIFMVYTK
jgi:hypothetical protein